MHVFVCYVVCSCHVGSGMNLLDISSKQWSSNALEVSPSLPSSPSSSHYLI